MATKVQHYRSTTTGNVPTTGGMGVGELALNLPDKRLFTSNGTAVFDAVQHVNSNFTIFGTNSLTIGNSTVNAVINSTAFNLVSGFANVAGLRVANSAATVANGTSNTAIIYLGNTNTRYLQYDGTNYVMPGGGLWVNGSMVWTGSNDGAGSGLDADTLDGYDSSAFGRLAGNPNYTSQIICSGTAAGYYVNSTAGGGLEIRSAVAAGTGAANGAAYIQFHRPLAYAAHFGLDTDNAWKVGGWSMGAVSYRLVHEGLSSVTLAGSMTATSYNTSSDISLKKDIKDFESIDIQAVDFKQFKMIDDEKEQVRYGVIAQELEKIAPELVSVDDKGKKTVNYMGLAVMFMKQVQLLDKYVKEIRFGEREPK